MIVPAPAPSAATLLALDRHIERALRQRFGSGGNLRHVVRLAVLEMAAGGAADEAIPRLLATPWRSIHSDTGGIGSRS